VEYSYLRAADKKHGAPEHIEKTVLFLVDASPVAKTNADAQDWDVEASSAKEAEEEAAAAVKAAWHAAKQAKEVRYDTSSKLQALPVIHIAVSAQTCTYIFPHKCLSSKQFCSQNVAILHILRIT